MKLNVGFYLQGVDRVTITDRGTPDTVSFVRESVVEQREADLLKQLEVAEETVDVLEQLLAKYAQEVLRLQTYNVLLRQMQKMSPPSAPAPLPPISPQQPWVWPPQPSDFPTQKIWCVSGAGCDLQFAINKVIR